MLNNTTIITMLYSMSQITKNEVYEYVCAGKITPTDYKVITSEVCPDIPVDVARRIKKQEISDTCKSILYGGFTSTVHYGVEKLFNTTIEDQANITGNSQAASSKLAGVEGCQNDKFYYAASGCPYEEWTPEEVNQLGREFKTFREATLFRSKALQAYVDTITTSSDILSISWQTDITAFMSTYLAV